MPRQLFVHALEWVMITITPLLSLSPPHLSLFQSPSVMSNGDLTVVSELMSETELPRIAEPPESVTISEVIIATNNRSIASCTIYSYNTWWCNNNQKQFIVSKGIKKIINTKSIQISLLLEIHVHFVAKFIHSDTNKLINVDYCLISITTRHSNN